MTMLAGLNTPQSLIFETLTSLIIIASCLMTYIRTKSLYKISLHKGLMYFSRANLYYTICFGANYIYHLSLFMNLSTPIIKIVLSIITLYTAIVGGVYISYSLVWRRFEKDRIKQPHPIKRAILYIAAAILSAMNILLMTVFGFTSPLLLYLVMIPIIMSAIVYNVKHRKAKKMFDPFLSYVVLALGIYLLFFIESLVISYLQIIHYYIWGIITVFFKAVSHNVYRLTRGGFK